MRYRVDEAVASTPVSTSDTALLRGVLNPRKSLSCVEGVCSSCTTSLATASE